MLRSADQKRWSIASYIVMVFCSLAALVPFVLLVIASFTDEKVAILEGYSFFPSKWSMAAYQYIWSQWSVIGRAYLMTIAVTLVGTVLSLVLTTLLAYMLSKQDLPGVKVLGFLVIFTMLFNGGLVPTYMLYSGTFHINDTFWALVIPNYLVSAFNVMLVKNYFMFSVPPALSEAARIDGCSEMGIFTRIVLPLSKPILATVGLLVGIMYWNEWQNGLYYLKTGSPLYTIQNILNAMNTNIQYLATNGVTGIDRSSIPTVTMRMAIAVVGILPIILAYPFFQKYLVAGITMGAVKE